MPRLLTITELQEKLGSPSRTALWALRRAPDFPRPIMLGGSDRVRRYVDTEIDAWMLRQPRDVGPQADGDSGTGPQTGEDAPDGAASPAGDVPAAGA